MKLPQIWIMVVMIGDFPIYNIDEVRLEKWKSWKTTRWWAKPVRQTEASCRALRTNSWNDPISHWSYLKRWQHTAWEKLQWSAREGRQDLGQVLFQSQMQFLQRQELLRKIDKRDHLLQIKEPRRQETVHLHGNGVRSRQYNFPFAQGVLLF